jgi:hypothetical protein
VVSPRESGPLPPEAAAAVRRALRELFRGAAVVNLDDVRTHLRQCDEGSVARRGAALNDDALHLAIVAGGEYVALRRGYAAKPAPNDAAAALRNLVLELLADRTSVGWGCWVVASGAGGGWGGAWLWRMAGESRPDTRVRRRGECAQGKHGWFTHLAVASAHPPRTGKTCELQLRKSDVVSAARDKSVAFVEAQYNKIMRDLCRNNSGTWTARTGKDDK